MISRRSLFKTLPLVGMAVGINAKLSWAAVVSSDNFATKLKFIPPKGSCDCHVHVFDPDHFPFAEERVYTPDSATLSDLERHLKELRMDRVVLVQPSPYGTDNRCMLNALKKLGHKKARGVAVVEDDISSDDLHILHDHGVRGLRLNMEARAGGKLSAEESGNYLKKMAGKIDSMGWHLQIYTNLHEISDLSKTISELPVPVVIDHLGKLKAEEGIQQSGFSELLTLLDSGKVYIKLSALYRVMKDSTWQNVRPFVEALVAHEPERLIWASDWPHTMPAPGKKRTRDGIEYFYPVDDISILNAFGEWLPTAKLRNEIFVNNPARLYWAK
ncbi:amidohydrolase family protein [Pantoea dispersa]|uniref:amidohydrolase family protein n=1 Tax=Pantoea dispersa TaxID=59814 RepID=UPI0021AFE67D|nr:amidohydrolase family protein [Pantoea dispersa]MCT6592519.1 amidohydrolase family protein [Pantoea dispersa]MCW0323463.1 2-pyrone-4,6-dicarbaxylate hydrolase [Pantoea dispersa]MCW0328199.1 2-pyrone-4,6-dicarbaxylate hydrolase [Pantoea dispersa]MCW0434602.1 2-pyrone-4,6-dicarbaxylate hydrolase [Pantoea dispersa]